MNTLEDNSVRSIEDKKIYMERKERGRAANV